MGLGLGLGLELGLGCSAWGDRFARLPSARMCETGRLMLWACNLGLGLGLGVGVGSR